MLPIGPKYASISPCEKSRPLLLGCDLLLKARDLMLLDAVGDMKASIPDARNKHAYRKHVVKQSSISVRNCWQRKESRQEVQALVAWGSPFCEVYEPGRFGWSLRLGGTVPVVLMARFACANLMFLLWRKRERGESGEHFAGRSARHTRRHFVWRAFKCFLPHASMLTGMQCLCIQR